MERSLTENGKGVKASQLAGCSSLCGPRMAHGTSPLHQRQLEATSAPETLDVERLKKGQQVRR